ncbi:hypothetical protein [Nocardia farcinica]|uniref:hypothetical protein n=1 Tax=Nocardia farcinica TaxID=37329 RepID=UPI001894FC43|nr:hypothetical protein [Nocardia farcinica]MBF6411000.1 hypothetical protein [Nocardia farcinica]
MSECAHIGNLTICRPSSWTVFSREPVGEKWCFGCRARLPHNWIVEGEEFPSYYDPVGRWECSRCGRDRTLFPGYVREGW